MSDNNRDLELNDSELENVSGGANNVQMEWVACQYCTKNMKVNILAPSAICPKCHRKNTFAG
jgi:bacteriocin-like protein